MIYVLFYEEGREDNYRSIPAYILHHKYKVNIANMWNIANTLGIVNTYKARAAFSTKAHIDTFAKWLINRHGFKELGFEEVDLDI